jgi:UDP-N-acetylmuramate--alanine ligase
MSERFHFIGIGGIGMSGLARILLEQNIDVSGSDIAASPITEALGAKMAIGHNSSNVSPSMTVVYSSGIPRDNPEYQAAVNLKCVMLHRSDLLFRLMQGYKTLAITGTHGKTTTSSLLSWVLSDCGLDPSFAVGGMISQFQSNGRHGKGEHFVAEADESDGSFLRYTPYGAIVTNIGLDHMNHYLSEEALTDAFKKFMSQVENTRLLFWCGDDERLRKLASPGVAYGFGEGCALRASRFRQGGWASSFDLSFEGKQYSSVETALIGRHNVLNALAVFGLALRLGIDEGEIRRAIKSFGGVRRRCELKGETHGVVFYDDYAHHPTEIRAVLGALRQAMPERRLVAVFQPHRYSRTKDCLGAYGNIFDAADVLLITDIYAAGEAPLPGITAETVLAEVRQHSAISSFYFSRRALAEELAKRALPRDVVVTLGAGDITKAGMEAIEALKNLGEMDEIRK